MQIDSDKVEQAINMGLIVAYYYGEKKINLFSTRMGEPDLKVYSVQYGGLNAEPLTKAGEKFLQM